MSVIPREKLVPASERGPAMDPGKGYRVQSLGVGAYMVTEGVYQMMLIVHNDGVLLADAPPSIGRRFDGFGWAA